MLNRRHIIAGALAAPVAFAASRGLGAVTPPSIYELLKEPGILDAAISPSGKQIAILGQSPDAYNGFTTAIALVNGDDPSAAGKRLDMGDMNIEAVEWANDDRLLVWLKKEVKITRSGPSGSASEDLIIRRILAIGADGSRPVLLFENNRKDFKGNINLGMVIDYLPADPDHIVMQAADYDHGVWALFRVNVRTGAATLMERGGDNTVGWTSFNGVPIARYESNRRNTVVTVSLRAPGETAWTPYKRMRRDENGRVDFSIAAMTEDPNTVLVVAKTEQDAVASLRSFSLATRQYGAEIVKRGAHDVETVVTDKTSHLIGTAFIEDRLAYEFADPGFKSHYRAIEGYFGKVCNVVLYDSDAARNRFLLWVTGPKEAGAYYFYDKTTRALEPMGGVREWLEPDRLAPMETLAVKARDGQMLTAYLTTPIAGSGPRPLVVMPHGGPESRDQYDWHPWAQVLAAQGWLVLQPNFRGSEGYGRAFLEAGWRRWGDRMQEDVEDCVAQVIADGKADPARVAIMGGSYGGYAALMGAVRRPELYKASVSIAGVSDLPDMLAWEKAEEGFDSPAYEYWRRNIGDPETDRAMLEAASPRRQAAVIAAPVLLIHGKDDDIVPVAQSKIMRDALKKAGKTVEYLEVADMGHRGWSAQQSIDVLTRAVEFLKPRLKA